MGNNYSITGESDFLLSVTVIQDCKDMRREDKKEEVSI